MDFERWLEQNPWPIVLCMTLPFALIGVYLIAQAWMAHRLVRASSNWPATVGRVVQSDVEMVRRRQSVSRANTYRIVYYPQVVYEYQVNGQVYRGSALSLTYRVGEGSRSDAEAKAAQYPVGATVQVYYNPADPTQAALQLSAPLNWVVALFGAGLVLMFVVLMATLGDFSFIGDILSGNIR